MQPIHLFSSSVLSQMRPRIKLHQHLPTQHTALDLLDQHIARIPLVENHRVYEHSDKVSFLANLPHKGI